jgi:hypothetical protein
MTIALRDNGLAVTLPALERSNYAQVLNALQAKRLTLGLLLNFGPKPQIKRFIMSR